MAQQIEVARVEMPSGNEYICVEVNTDVVEFHDGKIWIDTADVDDLGLPKIHLQKPKDWQ